MGRAQGIWVTSFLVNGHYLLYILVVEINFTDKCLVTIRLYVSTIECWVPAGGHLVNAFGV